MGEKLRMEKDNIMLHRTGKLSNLVMEDLMTKILNGTFTLGSYLPSEGEFCDIYQVSRSTVRDAVRGLEERGIVERQHGKGIKIIDKTEEVVANSLQVMMMSKKATLNQMLEVRRIIEIPAARLAAVNASSEDIKEMKESIENMVDTEVSNEEYVANDLKFHLLVAKASKNVILESIVKALSSQMEECIEVSLSEENRPERTQHYHDEVFKQIVLKNPDKAEKYMRNHLVETEKRVLNYFKTVEEEKKDSSIETE